MQLIVTIKFSPSSDAIMFTAEDRNISMFRFNLDMFDCYRFEWHGDAFEIADPAGRICRSGDLEGIAFYHARMAVDQPLENGSYFGSETKWVISWLNHVHDALVDYALDHHLLKLWTPFALLKTKPLQMKVAKKYFAVPDFRIHWGKTLDSHQVISKQLTQRTFSDFSVPFAQKVDAAALDERWPWFTQEIAEGDRDATVLYVNGHIHSYQFATVRGELTDWRVTQGTDRNRWIPWDPGRDFERKIDAYMKEMNLKYGRLDFIIGGKEPQFLEVNPCGQFGWLDDEKHTLHNEIVDAILDPSSTVTC